MTDRHPLDGNAIAADEHYDRSHPEDFDYCAECLRIFEEDPDHDCERRQHPRQWAMCEECGDLWEATH